MLQRKLLIAATSAAMISFAAHAAPAGGGGGMGPSGGAVLPPHIAQPTPGTNQPVNNQGVGGSTNTSIPTNPGTQSHPRDAQVPQPTTTPISPDGQPQQDPPGPPR